MSDVILRLVMMMMMMMTIMMMMMILIINNGNAIKCSLFCKDCEMYYNHKITSKSVTIISKN